MKQLIQIKLESYSSHTRGLLVKQRMNLSQERDLIKSWNGVAQISMVASYLMSATSRTAFIQHRAKHLKLDFLLLSSKRNYRMHGFFIPVQQVHPSLMTWRICFGWDSGEMVAYSKVSNNSNHPSKHGELKNVIQKIFKLY